MKSYLLKSLMFVFLLNLVILSLFSSTSFAKTAIAQQQSTDLVTLTVSSSCASANVRLSNGETLKTPFSKQFPRGQNVSFEVLDTSIATCGALPVVSPFRRLIVNNISLAKGEMSAQLTLDKDSSVLINYGFNDTPTVTLSGWTLCGQSQVRVTENQIAGQEGRFLTHFDLTLFRGQSLRLEAAPQVLCGGGAANLLNFHHWIVDGKSFPEGQLTVDVVPEKYTLAVPYYNSLMLPRIPITSFQLLRNGKPVDFIRQDDKLRKYTVILNADNFPEGAQAFVNGSPTQIIRATANQLEVILPGKRAQTPGIISILVVVPDDIYFAPVPVEVRKE
jgi:hypothetical protein